MPHYVDGTEAVVGDVVRGKGYNIKDENGELATIVGILVGVTPGVEQCNVKVLIPTAIAPTLANLASPLDGLTTYFAVPGRIEYGQADHFEKVT